MVANHPEYSTTLSFYVNGTAVSVENPRPETTLLMYLRNTLQLTGTKLGCAEGGCGACTVLVSQLDQSTQRIYHYSVNACLAPLCSMEGKHVITVEGIGNSKNPHPAQERIAYLFGSQCGFCTPGIVMSLYALLRNYPNPTKEQVEEAFDGNLCRCTGYRPILDAAKSFAGCDGCVGGGSGCCRNTTLSDSKDVVEFGPVKLEFKRYDASQEIIFPPALKNRLMSIADRPQHFQSSRCHWYRPLTLEHLLKLKQEFPHAKIIGGNTEVGIEMKFKSAKYPVLIYPMDIPDLKKITRQDDGVVFGANLTLSVFVQELSALVKALGTDGKNKNKMDAFKALLENLRWFAGRQIRNVATIAGNIVTASPISDMNPVFMASGARLKVQSDGKEARWINMEDFFLGYRKTALEANEVVLAVFVPFMRPDEVMLAIKQAKRRDDDIAIVTTGMRVWLDTEKSKVRDLILAYGGMGPTTLLARQVRKETSGATWSRDLIARVSELLTQQDVPIAASAPGGMPEYRRALAASFFFKFFLYASKESGIGVLDASEQRAIAPRHRPVSHGKQEFAQSINTAHVGKSVVHTSALKQVTGEALYTDDIKQQKDELYAGLVMSSKAHARILSVDPSKALEMPGVRAYVDHRDILGSNVIGPVFKDEEVFASKEVFFSGQVIGLILADDQMTAQEAAKLVKVEYEELDSILTIEEAIAKQSFFPLTKTMQRGDLEKGFKESEHVLEGEFRMGGQEHFYLETQATLAIPGAEDDEMLIWASTQNPTETQHLVAHALGVPSHKVVCRVKRMGGGFGGKETRSVPLSCALAVAARKLKRPVRCMLDRDEDIILSGQRHPFFGKYKVGFNKDGKIQAVDVKLYSNAGWSADLSLAVMERAVAHSDNVYMIPNMRAHGTVCRTNIHSNTAYRGFGGPQGMMVCETWLTHVADFLGKPVEELRQLNMYKEGQLAHFNQPLENFHVPRLWSELMKNSEFEKRRRDVAEFNKQNKWTKRGMSMIPTKFGIAFTARFLNQAGALVHVYTDGSVLLTHAGTEMGQGLYTKCVQVCAEAFGIPINQVHTSETATDKVANTSPTAASAGSDLNGMAVLDACHQINKRLEPYRAKHPNLPFKEIVLMAYRDRVNLSANGFYKTPDLAYEWDTNQGRLFNYFTFGVAISEVEVDTLTGDFQVLRADIMMDLGKSLNPSIDIGQIEGAFVQGMGWTTIEETLYFPNGAVFTRGPGNYKIPGFTDIPIDFRVSLLADAENPRAVHSSKAVGEPPFFLGTSVFFAIRDAIRAARVGRQNKSEYFRLDAPATPERIRMACLDEFTDVANTVKRMPGEKDWCVRA